MNESGTNTTPSDDQFDFDRWEDEGGPEMGVREPVRPPKPTKSGGASLTPPEPQEPVEAVGAAT